MPIKVDVVSIFTASNFAVLLSLRNKRHANIKGFTVYGNESGAGGKVRHY